MGHDAIFALVAQRLQNIFGNTAGDSGLRKARRNNCELVATQSSNHLALIRKLDTRVRQSAEGCRRQRARKDR